MAGVLFGARLVWHHSINKGPMHRVGNDDGDKRHQSVSNKPCLLSNRWGRGWGAEVHTLIRAGEGWGQQVWAESVRYMYIRMRECLE